MELLAATRGRHASSSAPPTASPASAVSHQCLAIGEGQRQFFGTRGATTVVSTRLFHISALFSIRHCDESRQFYDRKRAKGKRHIQAVLTLARHRVNILWALLRDGRCYEFTPPSALAA
ncbi:hypothetical protein ACFV16_34870 [Streptomyces massasporeus]|uniref:hypothetical protein n=1 Tax=Streptomyces massasporeus TaxID=67324 RepID=UPI0036A039C3